MGATATLAAVWVAMALGQPPRGLDSRPDRTPAKARKPKAQGAERDSAFEQARPRVGERLPEVTVWDADGKPFSTRTLRGRYTVLVFGCLT